MNHRPILPPPTGRSFLAHSLCRRCFGGLINLIYSLHLCAVDDIIIIHGYTIYMHLPLTNRMKKESACGFGYGGTLKWAALVPGRMIGNGITIGMSKPIDNFFCRTRATRSFYFNFIWFWTKPAVPPPPPPAHQLNRIYKCLPQRSYLYLWTKWMIKLTAAVGIFLQAAMATMTAPELIHSLILLFCPISYAWLRDVDPTDFSAAMQCIPTVGQTCRATESNRVQSYLPFVSFGLHFTRPARCAIAQCCALNMM